MSAELKEALEELAYWDELGKALGWAVHGWSYKHTCSYWTDPQHKYVLLQITGHQRDDIMRAINEKADNKG